jgi:hypothetical protein
MYLSVFLPIEETGQEQHKAKYFVPLDSFTKDLGREAGRFV